jgi:hypothetical protein
MFYTLFPLHILIKCCICQGYFLQFYWKFYFDSLNNLSPMFLTNKQNIVLTKYLLQPQNKLNPNCFTQYSWIKVTWTNMYQFTTVASLWTKVSVPLFNCQTSHIIVTYYGHINCQPCFIYHRSFNDTEVNVLTNEMREQLQMVN